MERSTVMANLSDLIITHPEITSFEDLESLVVEVGRSGEVLLYMDIKPDYRDTPRAWLQRLELAFYGTGRRNA
jgi:hypothetical protein